MDRDRFADDRVAPLLLEDSINGKGVDKTGGRSSCSSMRFYFHRLTRADTVAFVLLLCGLLSANLYNTWANITSYQHSRAHPISTASLQPFSMANFPMLLSVCQLVADPNTQMTALCDPTHPDACAHPDPSYPDPRCWCHDSYKPDIPGYFNDGCATINITRVLNTRHFLSDDGSYALIYLLASQRNQTKPSALPLQIFTGSWWQADLPYNSSIAVTSPFGKSAAMGGSLSGASFPWVSSLLAITVMHYDRTAIGGEYTSSYDLVNTGSFPALPLANWASNGAAIVIVLDDLPEYATLYTFSYRVALSESVAGIASVFTFSVSLFFFIFPLDGGHKVAFRFRLRQVKVL